MKRHKFQLDLPISVTAAEAYEIGKSHIRHPNYFDYECHGARKSPEPGKRRWSYSYKTTA